MTNKQMQIWNKHTRIIQARAAGESPATIALREGVSTHMVLKVVPSTHYINPETKRIACSSRSTLVALDPALVTCGTCKRIIARRQSLKKVI